MGTQLALFDAPPEPAPVSSQRPRAPAPLDPESPAAIALEIVTGLREAETALAGLAAELAPVDLGDRILETMRRQVARAEDDLAELRRLHADLLGCHVDELDARIEAQKAEERRAREEAKAARTTTTAATASAPPPSGRARRGAPAAAATATPAAPPTTRLDDRQRELLSLVAVDGNVARYTREERIPDWAALKSVMLALGSRWVSRRGFVFPDDLDGAERVRLALATGEVLDADAAGFFPTPAALADRLVALAEIQPDSVVLEPSAGRGAIAHAVRRACPHAVVQCIELLPDNRVALERDGFELLGEDFLSEDPARLGVFDAVVMNPPFAARADVHHIRHALRCLRPGGRLAAIASAGVAYRDDALGRAFRAELAEHGAEITPNPEGAFAESGTMVRTVMVRLTKRTA